MRRKHNLTERMNAADRHLVAKCRDDFFDLSEEDKFAYLNLEEIFGNDNPVYLEIGAGKGGFALETARRNPDINVLAVEKISNVIIEALDKAREEDPDNCMFMNVPAETLGYFIKPHKISRIYLNFSCPYPKSSYKNRRLTYRRFLELYKILLDENGEIYLKTDSENFFDYSIDSFEENGFKLKNVTRDLEDSPDNVVTEYEAEFRRLGKPIFRLEAYL